MFKMLLSFGTRTISVALASAMFTMALSGCASSDSPRPTTNELLATQAEERVAFDDLNVSFPHVRSVADRAHGYAIFPRITKGAIGIGGARGKGLVYRCGELIGTATISQASIGAQLGGSTFRQLILFEDERALRKMIVGDLELSARASAVGGDSGVGGDIDYNDGVVVYTVTVGGLMLDASIGTQDFDFRYLAP